MESISSVPSTERVARYIIEKSKFRPKDGSVRHSAFFPNKNMTTSVFRIDEMQDGEIAELGKGQVAIPQKKPLYGWGHLLVSDVVATKLQNVLVSLDVVPDTASHARHANIVGWPVDKAQYKLIAAKLAEAALFTPA